MRNKHLLPVANLCFSFIWGKLYCILTPNLLTKTILSHHFHFQVDVHRSYHQSSGSSPLAPVAPPLSSPRSVHSRAGVEEQRPTSAARSNQEPSAQAGLQEIERTTETGARVFECSMCRKEFKHRGHFNVHFLIHTGKKPYNCSVCKLAFSRKSILTAHYRQHTGEKPYKCNMCTDVFRNSGSLRYHLLAHNGKRSYKCKVCYREFSQKSALKAHSSEHSGKQPFKCDLCEKRYTNRQNLHNHVKIRHGEFPHKCKKCNKRFTWLYDLRSHSCSGFWRPWCGSAFVRTSRSGRSL